MQTVTTDERAQVAATSLASYAKIEITDPDGGWRDVSTGLSTPDWFNSATLSESIDTNTQAFNATLLRDAGTLSLAPLRTDSTVNRNGASAYAPMLDVARKWRVTTATIAQGATPSSGDWKEIGAGYIDTIDVQSPATEIQITGRGMEAPILDAQIKVVRTYCSDMPTLVETVIQQMLDDVMGTGATDTSLGGSGTLYSSGITLYTPSYSPAFYVGMGYRPATGGLMDAITKLAQLAGMVVRYRYDASNANRLTLMLPARSATTPDWTIGANEYTAIPVNRLDLSGVRTLIDLYYIDASTGQQKVTSPPSGTSDAITRYGIRFMRVDVAGTVTLTATQAQAMADAMRSDLELPALEQQFTTYAFWFVQLYDFGKLLANGIHYNSDQTGGVTSISHAISGGVLKTTVGLRGKPAGRYRTWLQYANQPITDGLNVPGKPALSDRIAPSTGVVDVLFDGDSLADETRVTIRTDRAPTLTEVLAGASGGAGVQTGACLAVATVPVGSRFWIGGASLNRFGEAGDLAVAASAFLGIDAAPLPTASFGTGVVQATQIAWPVTFGATTQRIYFFVEYDDSDPDSGTTAGKDVEESVSGVFTYYDRNESAVVAGVVLLKVPLRKSTTWVTVTAVPIDALNQRGPKANVKLQGPSSPPSAPNAPSIAGGTATSNTLPVTVTFPSSGTAATKIRPYLDGAPLADVAIGTWAYNGSQSYTYSGPTILPGTSHTLRVSLVTSGGVESVQSAAIPMTCAADTSGGGAGTGGNGKLATPLAGSASWSAQQASLVFAESYDPGIRISVWTCATSGGTYTRTSFTADAGASPALADAATNGTAYTIYYKLTAYDPTGIYTESDLSTALTVSVPAR